MSTRPLLSIVIATKNRIPYAINAITTILAMPEHDLELVVQDSSDTKDLQAFVNAHIIDKRLKYNYTPPPVSFIDNFNAAVGASTGEYVCVVGDDDGVTSEAIEAARWCKQNEYDSLKPKANVNYLWPGVSHVSASGVKRAGSMSVPRYSGKVIFPNITAEIQKLMCNGGQLYINTELPRVYHGIVRRECMERVRELTGHYFGGLSPDIYAVVGLSTVVKRAVSIDYPLTIAGACPESGSAANMKGRHVGNLADAPHFVGRADYEWSHVVPRFYSVETIWADAVMAALVDLKRDDLIAKFNIPMLAAHCIYSNPAYAALILRDMYRILSDLGSSRISATLQLTTSAIVGPGAHFCGRVISRLVSYMPGYSTEWVFGLENVEDATAALDGILRSRGCSFTACVADTLHRGVAAAEEELAGQVF